MDLHTIRRIARLGLAKSCDVSTLTRYASQRDLGHEWGAICGAMGAMTLADLLELQTEDVRASCLLPVQQRKLLNLLEDLQVEFKLPPWAKSSSSTTHRKRDELVDFQTSGGAVVELKPSRGITCSPPPRKRVKLVARRALPNAVDRSRDGLHEKDEQEDSGGSVSMHVVFVLDTSRSMEMWDVDGADTRMDAVFQAVSDFLYQQSDAAAKACALRNEVIVYSLVLFSSAKETRISFENLPVHAAQAQLERVWASVQPWGPTNYSDGLKALTSVVATVEKEIEGPCSFPEHIALFLSDGKPGDSPYQTEALVKDLRGKVSNRLHLHTLGFGKEATAGSLKRMAELGGGEFLENVGVPEDIAKCRVRDSAASTCLESSQQSVICSKGSSVSKLQAASLSHAFTSVLKTSMNSVRLSSVAPHVHSTTLRNKIDSLQRKLLEPIMSDNAGAEEAEEVWSAVRMMENHGTFVVSGQDKLLFADHFEDVLDTIKSVPLRTVRLSKHPFASGGMRLVHRMWDKPPQRKDADQQESLALVAKQTYLSKVDEQCAIDKMLKTNRTFLEMHSAAAACASIFNRKLNLQSKVSFVDAYVYLLLDEKRSVQRCYNAEKYLEGMYVKYNNNGGQVNESRDDVNLLAQAFSHFSFEWSGHDSIIVDIQGVNMQWTDPQMHSRQGCFGDGDYGSKGIQLFLESHCCNHYCRQLGLSSPDKQASSSSCGRVDDEICPSKSCAEGSSQPTASCRRVELRSSSKSRKQASILEQLDRALEE